MARPLLQFNEKVAIVTGSGRGIGAATALRLANEGAHVVINDLVAENAKAMSSQIEKLGRKSHVSTHDVSDSKSAHGLVEEVKSKFGGVDILVNNAGITRDALLMKMTEDQWDEVIRVNLKGVFNMGQACAKAMSEKKYGKIVNVSSVSWLGNIGQTNYSASKAGVVGITRSWALELARFNINVNAVAPGFIDSALTQKMPPEIKEKFIQKIPAKRIGQPEDIAHLITFLVSDAASYITGQCIQIDGGLSVGIGS